MEDRPNSTYEVRRRAVNAVLRGRSMSDVADAFHTNRSTVSRWVNRFQQEGDEGILRGAVSDRPRKLEELTEEELCNIVLKPASNFGFESDLWTVSCLHA